MMSGIASAYAGLRTSRMLSGVLTVASGPWVRVVWEGSTEGARGMNRRLDSFIVHDDWLVFCNPFRVGKIAGPSGGIWFSPSSLARNPQPPATFWHPFGMLFGDARQWCVRRECREICKEV